MAKFKYDITIEAEVTQERRFTVEADSEDELKKILEEGDVEFDDDEDFGYPEFEEIDVVYNLKTLKIEEKEEIKNGRFNNGLGHLY